MFAVPCHLNKRLSNETGGVVPKTKKRYSQKRPHPVVPQMDDGWPEIFEFIG
jgi:hypothetical protein